jgi:N-acetyl-anhydromuramoyl-L-alanine amidase
MTLRRDGIAAGMRYVPSPNCDERPPGEAVTLIVVHSISLPPGLFSGDSVEQFFTNRLDRAAHPYFEEIGGLRVSAHFFVRRDGECIQFVPVGMRAWHAGASQWRGRDRCNDFSIGVELEGTDDAGYEPAQYRSLATLVRTLRAALPVSAIAAHSDIAPSRKTDPGPLFEWRRCLSLLARD